MLTDPRFSSLPEDRSLAAYRTWIKAITESVGGNSVDDPEKDSEEAWARDHAEFWRRFDEFRE